MIPVLIYCTLEGSSLEVSANQCHELLQNMIVLLREITQEGRFGEVPLLNRESSSLPFPFCFWFGFGTPGSGLLSQRQCTFPLARETDSLAHIKSTLAVEPAGTIRVIFLVRITPSFQP